jgi:hypothetical protein
VDFTPYLPFMGIEAVHPPLPNASKPQVIVPLLSTSYDFRFTASTPEGDQGERNGANMTSVTLYQFVR